MAKLPLEGGESPTSPGSGRARTARCNSPISAPTSSASRPHAAVRDAAVAAVARGQTRHQPLRLLQPVQPGQALADAQLQGPAALEVARRLVATSDVVTNNFAAGVMDKMGLGYEALRKIKPDIIMISLSGYGDTGPYHEYVAYGPAQVPLSGFSALTGYTGWPPMHTGFSYADPNAGVHGAFALLAALYHRGRPARASTST